LPPKDTLISRLRGMFCLCRALGAALE
jgi:hypothetical protein